MHLDEDIFRAGTVEPWIDPVAPKGGDREIVSMDELIPAENPKEKAGRQKPALFSVIPTAALLHLGEVMKLGARKYGPFNWRETRVPAQTYVDAAGRHLLSWLDGEDEDPESGMSHLAHIMACCAIIIDAKENGMLEDNRPKAGRTGEMISNFQATGKFNP